MNKNQKDREPQLIDNERVRQIEFVSEGKMLQGTIFSPEVLKEKNPGLLFIHGSPSRGQAGQVEYADAVAKAGYMAMTFDLSGHGASQGGDQPPVMENFLNDTTAAYDRFVQEAALDPKKITVVGGSLGSYLALMLAERKRVENLVLQNPANFPDNVLEKPVTDYTGTEPVLEWRQQPLKFDSNASLKAIHEFKGNVLIVESELDELIPHQSTENYVKAVKDTSRVRREVLPGAKHYLADPAQRMQYQNMLLAWLQEKCPIENHE